MQQVDVLAESILYLAGALDDGQIDPARIDGAMLRSLVDAARSLPDEVTIDTVWTQAHNVIAAAWRWRSPDQTRA